MVQNAPAVSDHPGCYKLKAKSCKRTIIITIMIWKKRVLTKYLWMTLFQLPLKNIFFLIQYYL